MAKVSGAAAPGVAAKTPAVSGTAAGAVAGSAALVKPVDAVRVGAVRVDAVRVGAVLVNGGAGCAAVIAAAPVAAAPVIAVVVDTVVVDAVGVDAVLPNGVVVDAAAGSLAPVVVCKLLRRKGAGIDGSDTGLCAFPDLVDVRGMAGTTVDRAGRPGVLGKAPTVCSDRLGGVGAARSAEGRCHQVDDAAKAGGTSEFCRTRLARSVRLAAGSSMSFGGVNDRRRAIGVDVPRAAAERPIDIVAHVPRAAAERPSDRAAVVGGAAVPAAPAMTALGNAAPAKTALGNAALVNVVLVSGVLVNALAVILAPVAERNPLGGNSVGAPAVPVARCVVERLSVPDARTTAVLVAPAR